MSNGPLSQLVNSISEIDLLFTIARKHGVRHLKVGDIEAVIGDLPEPTKPELTTARADDKSVADIDAEAQHLYRSI